MFFSLCRMNATRSDVGWAGLFVGLGIFFLCILLWYNVFVMIVLILFCLFLSFHFCSFTSVTPGICRRYVYRRNLCISILVLYPVSLVFNSCILASVHRSMLSSEGTLQRFLNKESLKILHVINNSKAVLCIFIYC